MQLFAQNNTETKAVIAENSNKPSAIVEGGGIVLGGLVVSAGVWAAISKLLERFGNSAIDARQKEVDQKLEEQKQELEEQKKLSQFFIDRAQSDSKTVADTLERTSTQLQKVSEIVVAKYLNDNKQLWDIVYDQKAEIAAIKDELTRINENLLIVQSTLKDIFTVLKIKERQNS